MKTNELLWGFGFLVLFLQMGWAQETSKPNFFELNQQWLDRLDSYKEQAESNAEIDLDGEDGLFAKYHRWYNLMVI